MDYSNFLKSVDEISGVLEKMGMVDEAYNLDVMSNTLESLLSYRNKKTAAISDLNKDYDAFVRKMQEDGYGSKTETSVLDKERGHVRGNILRRRYFIDIINALNKALMMVTDETHKKMDVNASKIYSVIQDYQGRDFFNPSRDLRDMNSKIQSHLKQISSNSFEGLSSLSVEDATMLSGIFNKFYELIDRYPLGKVGPFYTLLNNFKRKRKRDIENILKEDPITTPSDIPSSEQIKMRQEKRRRIEEDLRGKEQELIQNAREDEKFRKEQAQRARKLDTGVTKRYSSLLKVSDLITDIFINIFERGI